MRIYLAGPMTGYPDHNKPAFDVAARALRQLGHDVTTPAEIARAHPGASLVSLIPLDLAAVCQADAVVLLPGWERSKGVALEKHAAEYCGVRVVLLAEVLCANKFREVERARAAATIPCP
ncbi:MAG: DUF4406 domain-containing protein [Vulcanimicrobiaceae bacterium]